MTGDPTLTHMHVTIRTFDALEVTPHWYGVSKCDPRAVGLYARHYSAKKNGKKIKDWLEHGITSNGESITLLTYDCSALFVWLKQEKRDDGQMGVNCAVFRNEGQILSSDLILEAETFAYERWGNVRLFTYVDPQEIRSSNPGYCFKRAGWKNCGTNKRGLVVLEKNTEAEQQAAEAADVLEWIPPAEPEQELRDAWDRSDEYLADMDAWQREWNATYEDLRML